MHMQGLLRAEYLLLIKPTSQTFTLLQIVDKPVRSESQSGGVDKKLTCNRLDIKVCKQPCDKAAFLGIHKVDLHTIKTTQSSGRWSVWLVDLQDQYCSRNKLGIPTLPSCLLCLTRNLSLRFPDTNTTLNGTRTTLKILWFPCPSSSSTVSSQTWAQ